MTNKKRAGKRQPRHIINPLATLGRKLPVPSHIISNILDHYMESFQRLQDASMTSLDVNTLINALNIAESLTNFAAGREFLVYFKDAQAALYDILVARKADPEGYRVPDGVAQSLARAFEMFETQLHLANFGQLQDATKQVQEFDRQKHSLLPGVH